MDSTRRGLRLTSSDTHLLTTSHDLHRRRRKLLEPFFSRQGVSRLDHTLAEVVEKLAGRLVALKGTNTVIRLDHASGALSGEIIGRICWGDEGEFLDDPNFAAERYVAPKARQQVVFSLLI